MAQASNIARSAAAATLKESVRDLRRCMAAGEPSHRLLQVKYEKVKAEKTDLFSKHCTYAEKNNLDLESQELTQWIEPKMDDASALLDEVFEKLEVFSSAELQVQKANELALENTKSEQDIKIAERQCTAEEKTLREFIAAMKLYIEDEGHASLEHAPAAHTYLAQIDESLGELNKSWNVLKRLPAISAAKLEEVFKTEETLKTFVAKERVSLLAFISKVDPENSIVTKNSSESVAGSVSGETKEFDSNQLKSERVRNPKFTGDIRAFANFKNDFEKIVAQKYTDKTHQAYVMKQSCLVGECKKLVENLNDIDKIWERLEMRYGDSDEIVNVIVQDLESFKFSKNNHYQDMISLVDQLEKGLQDLAVINAEHEISSAFTVTLIERKMPKQVFDRWTERELGEDSDRDSDSSERSKKSLTKFEKLFNFLLKERKKAQKALLNRDRIDRANPPPPPPQLPRGKHLGAGALQQQQQQQ